jgi:hypothetical protein
MPQPEAEPAASVLTWEPASAWEAGEVRKRARRSPDLLTQEEKDWYLSYIDGLDFVGLTREYVINVFFDAQWRFSPLGLFWALVGVVAIVLGFDAGNLLWVLISFLIFGYSAYLFAGGRWKFFAL